MGEYHCTVDLLFDWFGLVCFANKNKNCQLSYSWFQTSQTGGQWYSDTSPFSIPCYNYLTWFIAMFAERWVSYSWREQKDDTGAGLVDRMMFPRA
jgi:hypothetical protein